MTIIVILGKAAKIMLSKFKMQVDFCNFFNNKITTKISDLTVFMCILIMQLNKYNDHYIELQYC